MDHPPPRLAASHALWERARRVMPGGVYGHQNGAALGEGHPRFVARAERSRVWDVDGNEYVDWMCAYGPMILGYGHPAVEAAVAEQLASGDCLPLPGPRMVELAERLVALTPRADFAVFGKNGADATSWAVDVARAHTGRPRIARVRGAYHAARPWALPHLPGVPEHYRDDLLEFAWNDLAELGALFAAHPGEIAVVMTAPFDHVTGAAPERIYFTGSFFFASGSFAAALATLDVLARTDAIARIQRIGALLSDGLAEQARRHGVPLMPVGQPAMPVIRFADDPERRRMRRWCSLVTAGGAYAHPTHNWFVSAAHTEEDVGRTLEAAERAFKTVAAEG